MRCAIVLLAVLALAWGAPNADLSHGSSTSTAWRNDEANLEIVRELNWTLEHLPFSAEHEGVSDDCPIRIDWTVGPNLPLPWKGGVSGVFGEEIALAGGAWDGNQAFSYNVKTGTYQRIPPPPAATSFTQGTSDGQHLYLVGGKTAGQTAAKLSRTAAGWKWTSLPPVPEANRWTGTAAVVGNWLCVYEGFVTTKDPQPAGAGGPVPGPRVDLPAWRLRLDSPRADWEPMAPFPGQATSVINGAVARGRLYAFGGWRENRSLAERLETINLWKKYSIWPYHRVNSYRDAYRYDPATDRWTAIRKLPFPMYGGAGIVLQDRYILLMGTHAGQGGPLAIRTVRVGKSHPARKPNLDQYWTGYDDTILCYDVETDTYSRVGLMLYGVSNWSWALVGDKIYGFGGEPYHGFNSNRETVLQIGTIRRVSVRR